MAAKTAHLARISAALDAISDEEDATLVQAAESDPDAPHATRPLRRGRPPAAVVKQKIMLRLDPDVVAAFKAGGEGWQTRMNDALRRAANLDS